MQTARGASLGTGDPAHEPADDPAGHPADDPADDSPGRTHSRRRLLLLFAVVALVGYATDLLTKVLAVDRLTGRAPVHVVGDLVTLYLARNPGAAFSTGTGYTLLISLVAVAAALAVLWVARRLGSTGWALGLGFLLAGVLGNLTDRIFREPGVLRGHVVDFIRFPHFPIFNVADVCINIAAVFVVVQALRGIAVSGVRERRASRSTGDPDEPSR